MLTKRRARRLRRQYTSLAREFALADVRDNSVNPNWPRRRASEWRAWFVLCWPSLRAVL
jgi:hypothetical protein